MVVFPPKLELFLFCFFFLLAEKPASQFRRTNLNCFTMGPMHRPLLAGTSIQSALCYSAICESFQVVESLWSSGAAARPPPRFVLPLIGKLTCREANRVASGVGGLCGGNNCALWRHNCACASLAVAVARTPSAASVVSARKTR